MAYPESYHRRAEALFRKGHSIAEISRRLGVTKGAVTRWLTACGLHKPTRYRRYRVSDQRRALKLYKAGLNCGQVERVTGLPHATVYHWVRSARLPRHDLAARNDEMLELRRNGWSIDYLSDRYDLMPSTVCSLIAKTKARQRREAA